ncbi:unnamed protein product, partial [Phaeothamnion confervicola]
MGRGWKGRQALDFVMLLVFVRLAVGFGAWRERKGANVVEFAHRWMRRFISTIFRAVLPGPAGANWRQLMAGCGLLTLHSLLFAFPASPLLCIAADRLGSSLPLQPLCHGVDWASAVQQRLHLQ